MMVSKQPQKQVKKQSVQRAVSQFSSSICRLAFSSAGEKRNEEKSDKSKNFPKRPVKENKNFLNS